MKASYRWLKTLVPGLTATGVELAARFTAAGLEVEAIQEYGEASASCIVVSVESQRPHPTKSGLSLVTVDRGGGSLLEVVCGAPNVPAKGGLVVLAPLGVHLPATGVTIQHRTIAGVASEGMLCSESELGLTDESGGILVLPPGLAKPGTLLKDAIPEAFDAIFELGLTPNRSDALGHIGLAREAAALYALPWKLPSPGAPARTAAGKVDALATVTVEDPERCPHYGAAAVIDVTVAPSPLWLRYRLSALGVRPISNVVDVTNLVLLEYGHPMHAFDLDRVRPASAASRPIIVRRARDGEPLETLDGASHTLVADDLVIADGEGAVALAGVMGGASSEITSATQRVLLECAFFEPRGVRRASRRHALHTDSSHRFERGVDPTDVGDVLARASSLLTELAGGSAVPGEIHVKAPPPAPPKAKLRSARLDGLLGVCVPWQEALDILVRLGCRVEKAGDGTADVTPPAHRPDITREVDLIEEVARVRGMEAIPVVLPRIRPSREDAPRERITRLARAAGVELGLSEAVTYSFVSRASLEKVGAPAPSVILKNPLSLEQEVMRTSLLPGLLDAVSYARRHGERDARVFTVGSIFLGSTGQDELPEEPVVFAALLAGERAAYLAKPEPVDVWDAKGLAEGLVRRVTGRGHVGVERFLPAEVPSHLHPRGASRVTLGGSGPGASVGSLGPIHPDVLARWDLAPPVMLVEVSLSLLASHVKPPSRFVPIPRFPPSARDLALVVHDDVAAGDVELAVREAAGALASEVTLFDRFVGGAIPPDHQSLAFRIVYRADAHTLTDPEVDAQHAKVVAAVGQRFGATLR